MISPLKLGFDGTWRFKNEKEVDGWNYLHFSKGNRIAQFYNIKNGTFEVGRMLVGDIGNNLIEFFPQDGSKGWTRSYRFDDGNLVIIEGKDEYPCSRVQDPPVWLEEGIAAADRFFDEFEGTWGEERGQSHAS